MAKRKKYNKSKRKRKKENQHVETQGSYVVEEIIDWGLHDNGLVMYLLKWEGYDESENSWEFEYQVTDCVQLKRQFHFNSINGRHPPKYSFQEYDKFIQYLKDIIDVNYQDLAVLRLLSSKKLSLAELTSNKVIEEIKFKVRSEYNKLLEKNFKTRNNSERIESRELAAKVTKALHILKNFGSITNFFEFVDKRKTLKDDLKRWQTEQNKIIEEEKEGLPISIVNDIDLEVPVLDKYITRYILDVNIGSDLKIEDETPLVSCECEDCYKSRHQCCTAVIGFPMVYNNKGLLSSSRFNTIIFECNNNCKCSPNCSNRAIQRGRKCLLQIFRTESKVRGWGVRALEPIARGSFISQYTGEIISLIEAEQRPTTYLFDLSAHLDSSDVEFTYVVDASRFGNITRFVNHSCDPNCRVLFAWIKSYNKLLPIIALFAIKPIRAFEELTYDYSMELIDLYNHNDDDSSSESDSDSDMESSNFTEFTPFGAQIEASTDEKSKEVGETMKQTDKSECEENSRLINQSKNLLQERQRKVPFTKIECQCGAKNCRQFLYS